MSELTHFDANGNARMVDVGEKEVTRRVAKARGRVQMNESTLRLIQDQKIQKGDVLGLARVAGIMGAKKTSDLIPLCHPLPLDSLEIDFRFADQNSIEILATASTHGKTGVEMEALSGVMIAALTIYDMCKSVDREMAVSDVCLIEKSGGKSGHFLRNTNEG